MAESLAEVEKRVREQFNTIVATEYTDEKIRTKIRKMIEGKVDEIVLVSLGFEKDRWGNNSTWSVDHCNGRAGESTIGKMIADMARHEINKTIQQMISNGHFTVPKSVQTAMDKEFNEYFKSYNFRQEIHKLAEEKAHRLFDILKGNLGA